MLLGVEAGYAVWAEIEQPKAMKVDQSCLHSEPIPYVMDEPGDIGSLMQAMCHDEESSDGNRPRAARVRVSGLGFNSGLVVDLSVTGAKLWLRRPWAIGETRELTLQGHGQVTVAVRVVWSRRIGFLKHVVGVSFDDVTVEKRKDLARLARLHCVTQSQLAGAA